MFEKQLFIKSATKMKDLPVLRLPEVILCGRSNVGKSSFLNTLFNKKNLAKISSTPGKTRTLNYYSIDELFYIVDLPGFGYAKVSKTERETWGKFVTEFIKKSEYIRLAIHLIDSRHNPTSLDIMLNSMLKQNSIPYLVVLSKSDKLKQSEMVSSKKNIIKFFPELTSEENLIFFSSVKKTGRKEVLGLFSEMFY